MSHAGSILIREGLIGEDVTAKAVNSPVPNPAQDIGAGHGYSGGYKEYNSSANIRVPGVKYHAKGSKEYCCKDSDTS